MFLQNRKIAAVESSHLAGDREIPKVILTAAGAVVVIQGGKIDADVHQKGEAEAVVEATMIADGSIASPHRRPIQDPSPAQIAPALLGANAGRTTSMSRIGTIDQNAVAIHVARIVVTRTTEMLVEAVQADIMSVVPIIVGNMIQEVGIDMVHASGIEVIGQC